MFFIKSFQGGKTVNNVLDEQYKGKLTSEWLPIWYLQISQKVDLFWQIFALASEMGQTKIKAIYHIRQQIIPH